MNYNEAREYINSRAKFGIKPGLERIRRLAAMLCDPQDKIMTIHVAGTNGKGSVCVMLSSILSTAGYKTGLYTSPYVTDYLEQFKINGKSMPEDKYAEIIARIKYKADLLDSENDYPTEYEVNTIAAFMWFFESGCDYAVIETGLGGLMDATNIISKPELCVITSISLDHMNILGATIEEITEQKAGIIKPSCPVVISNGQKESVKSIIRSHITDASPVFCENFEEVSVSLSGTSFIYESELYSLPLIGIHQCENAVTALTAAKALIPGLLRENINSGFAAIVHPARFEVFDLDVPVVLDGAHNKGGAQVLKETIEAVFAGKRLTGIMGMLADKEYSECASLLAPRFEKIYTVTPDSSRALPADKLCETIATHTECKVCENFNEAFKKSLSAGLPVVIFGSLYLARIARNVIINYSERIKLLNNLHLLHTTAPGAERIRKNLRLDISDIDEYCKGVICKPECVISRRGKNFYCEANNIRLTVNAYSYTIITAHLI